MQKFLCLFLVFLPVLLAAQKKDTVLAAAPADSLLQEVVVNAFQSHKNWKAVPAAIAVIGTKEIGRYSGASLVPVLNTVPGIRMEERSPASYRLSVRGSLLRSPFGVRNVKVYWNDIPLTDAGGNTYLNLVEMSQLTGAEIIKGPAASVYGAGTGGALLLESMLAYSDSSKHQFTAGLTGGAYGLFQEQTGWLYSTKQFASSLQQTHARSDGYRDQSASRRDALKWQGNWQLAKQAFHFLIAYTDLFYQTPGGISLAQMQLNPKLSRQAAGALPGAIQQKAAIYNQTVLGALHHETSLGGHFALRSFLTANHTSFTNPFITNYEKRGEANIGMGTSVVYETQKDNHTIQWTTGVEWLQNHSLISDFGNRSGNADTVQFRDDIYARQWFAYSQLQYGVADKWVLTAGLSLNNQSFQYKRTTDNPAIVSNKKISMVFTPRLAVLYRLNADVSLYALAAKGFSPPALAEIRPSDGNYYGNLEAEYGWNYEVGIKGELFAHCLRFDVAAYFFRLQNAIVRRSNAAGAEYFVNAGSVRQDGMEAMLRYRFTKKKPGQPQVDVWSSYSYQPYRFTEYVQNTNNYSGNELTGVPRNIWVTGIDLQTAKGWYLNLSLNATSRLPLTDVNDAYAEAYQLLQGKLGYRCGKHHRQMDIFLGTDNALNQVYSLGNDINAAGKRYYNPAAGRNVFAGIQYRL